MYQLTSRQTAATFIPNKQKYSITNIEIDSLKNLTARKTT